MNAADDRGRESSIDFHSNFSPRLAIRVVLICKKISIKAYRFLKKKSERTSAETISVVSPSTKSIDLRILKARSRSEKKKKPLQ